MLVEQLTDLITAADVAGVDKLLRSLDGADRAEVKRWFEGSRSWFRELQTKPLPSEQLLDIHHARQWCEGICAVSLLGAVTAAGRAPWREYWSYRRWPGEDEFINQLRDADREWVAAFADAASRARLGGNARNTNATLTRVLRAAVTHHELPSPSGATFLREWLAGSPEGPLLDILRRDPLMPELLYLYLASGECGRTPGLADAVISLVDDGKVDRKRLIDVVLEQLTTQQRPASQRVLAELVRGLEVTAAEVPGGLSYLVGVVATSQGVVGQVLLPLAIDVVEDAAGLAELVSVIASRAERKQKDVLLRALQGEALHSRVGDQAVLEALRLLGADGDVAFAAKVAKARAGLGDVPEAQAEPDVSLGLWERAPEVLPADQVRPLWWWRTDLLGTWQQMLRSGPPIKDEVGIWAINAALNEIAFGTFNFEAIAEKAGALLLAGKLSMSRTTSLFEDLFLGGAMSQAWPVALAVADAACAGARRPAGVERLLRMLTGYTREAPRQEVPPHIEALAAGTGETKAEQEARALGAALTRETVADYLTRLRARVDAPTVVKVRGLWSCDQHASAHPASQWIRPKAEVDLDELRLSAEDYDWLYYDLRCAAADGAMVRSELLLRDVVTAVRQHGVNAVRDCLEAVERRMAPGPVGAAIDLWAREGLSAAAFWKLVLTARPHRDAMAQLLADSNLTGRGRQDLMMKPHLFTTHLADAVPTLPFSVRGPFARTAFFRACEAMVRIERGPVLLSIPTYGDGTLGFDELLSRLEACRPDGVGPLDLVQALYRLRATDPGRAADLDLPAVMTNADLTSPGGHDTWNALEVVRTWVTAGGLPTLTSRPSADGSRWAFTADPPVDWDRCAAAPSGMLDDNPSHGETGAVARALPLWPDRVLLQPFADGRGADDFTIGLLQMSGDFGLASHDYLLGALVRLDEVRRQDSVVRLAELIGQDRFDSELAVAAALGRYERGSLALPASVHCWGEIFERGGLRGLWPLAVAIAGALCELTPRPSGLQALLRLLTAYAHEVPEPVVPDGIRRLAESRGSTRTHVEARALVAAITRGSQ